MLTCSSLQNVIFLPLEKCRQGCYGTNLDVYFFRQEKHRKFAKNIKNMFLHRGIYLQHREKFDVSKIKLCTRNNFLALKQVLN